MPPSSLDLAAVPGADGPLGLALQLCTMVVGTRKIHTTLYTAVRSTSYDLSTAVPTIVESNTYKSRYPSPL